MTRPTRDAALRAMGGVEQRRNSAVTPAASASSRTWSSDSPLRAAAVRRSPGFTAVAMVSLALGIGANTAMFQLLDAIGLRTLPVERPRELAEVRIAGGNGGFGRSENSTRR